jgi:hypothetical protein
MNEYQVYYVYLHVDPETHETLYVGHGSRHRAWVYSTAPKGGKRYGHRNKQHFDRLLDLTNKGYLPSDWVEIIERGLTKEQAKELEKEMIETYKPLLNRAKGLGSYIDKDRLKEAQRLKQCGIVGTEASKLLGVSKMTTWRYQYVY